MATTLSREMQPNLAVLKLVLNALGVKPAIATVDDRKRVQKAIYLGQRAGVDLGYRYGWYKKGPYSPMLTRDNYALAEAMEIGEHVNGAQLRNPGAHDRLQDISKMFSVPKGVPLSIEDWLELLASVDYLKTVSKVQDDEASTVIENQKPALHPYLEQGKKALREFGLLAA